MILDSKKFENYHCDQYISSYNPHDGIETMSLADLEREVMNMKKAVLMNKLDPEKIPLFIESNNKKYCVEGAGYGFGKIGTVCYINTQFLEKNNKGKFIQFTKILSNSII